ncbi:MAG TPA: tetratricopeptide repeat protein [Desulfuromonadales bacterium]|nr:tetratricopeptide repeat protein [Desulfuromonadales bacterium]
MTIFRTIPALLLLVLVAVPARAATLPPASPAGMMSFADALYNQGDYYRAITEYRRFLFFFPDDHSAPRAALQIGESDLAGKRWNDAETALHKVMDDYPATGEAHRAALLFAGVPFRRGNYSLARRRYRKLLGGGTLDAAADAEVRYRIAWTLIEENRYAAAAATLSAVGRPRAADLAAALPPLEKLPRKSPALAGGLSAVLPGAGQLYAGRPRDAGLSLALNSAFILGAWQSFDHGLPALGGLLAFFEAGWYTGNIFNAVNSTEKYNRDVRGAAKERLHRRFGISLGFTGHTPRLDLSWDF